MAKFYLGSEIKFSIELTAPGFSMDTDDFEIEISSSRGSSIHGYKTPKTGETTDVVIFKEDNTWYAIADTSKLTLGDLKVIATARIPDANANDGIRNEIAVSSLGTLTNP